MRLPRVAYQGLPGSFSELAAIRFCGERFVPLACRRFADVFTALAAGRADYAALPYFNSLAGPVRESCAFLASEPVRVCNEIGVAVTHALIAPPGVEMADIRHVYSHPMALRQCRRLFRRHPGWQACETFDTAGAVLQVLASGRKDSAAIAYAGSARLYGAKLLVDDIQDSNKNNTRFVLIEPTKASGMRLFDKNLTYRRSTKQGRPGRPA